MGLRSLASWECWLESLRGHGSLTLVSVVCCQLEFSASGWSPVQRSPTECGAFLTVIVKSRQWGGPGPLGAVPSWKKNAYMSERMYISTKIICVTSYCIIIKPNRSQHLKARKSATYFGSLLSHRQAVYRNLKTIQFYNCKYWIFKFRSQACYND